MDTGLTTIPEADIEKHRATAQSMITRVVVLEDSSRESGTALAGTNRRFVSTVSAGSVRKTREVELTKTVASVHPGDQLLSIVALGGDDHLRGEDALGLEAGLDPLKTREACQQETGGDQQDERQRDFSHQES